MSKQEIIDRILADATAEASAIVEEANAKATEILAAAEAFARQETSETESECREYAKDLLEKKAAAARLESAKIALQEKRKVLDYVYAVALLRLKEQVAKDPLAVYSVLLEKYAEQGDVVYFPEGFAYVEGVSALPVFAKKGLQVGAERVSIDGGMLLVGEKADKDVSFTALIERDKEAHLAELATEIF